MTMYKKILSFCFVGLLASATVARATTMTFDSVAGSDSDGTLSAQAIFTTSTGEVQISLANLLSAASIGSQGQAVSDISFTLLNTSGALTLVSLTASGQQGDVSHSGKLTDTLGAPTAFLGESGGGTYSETNGSGSKANTANFTLDATGGGQPVQMILPYLADGDTYASLAPGADSHNPYTIGPATFDLFYTGITAGTTISNVTFSFGTGPDQNLGGYQVPNATPEPSSLLLLGTGILGAAALLRRRSVLNRG